MHMNYEITKFSDRFEAEAKLHWYASTGRYNVNAIGHGKTVEEAKKNASLMLGQARAALYVALIESVPHRVPETPAERENGPAEHRT